MALTLTVQILADIIREGMGLEMDQVWVYDQRRELPKDDRVYAVTHLIGMQPYGNNRRLVPGSDTLVQQRTQHMQETISVAVFSRSVNVLGQYPIALSAIVGDYSAKAQIQYGMAIGSIPMSFADTSYRDGAAMIYRATMTLRVLRGYTTVPGEVDFYTTFTSETTTED